MNQYMVDLPLPNKVKETEGRRLESVTQQDICQEESEEVERNAFNMSMQTRGKASLPKALKQLPEHPEHYQTYSNCLGKVKNMDKQLSSLSTNCRACELKLLKLVEQKPDEKTMAELLQAGLEKLKQSTMLLQGNLQDNLAQAQEVTLTTEPPEVATTTAALGKVVSEVERHMKSAKKELEVVNAFLSKGG